jgi:hypothetical protein
MSPKDVDAEDRAEQRSEFLRGQMREWMEQVGSAGKTRELFELEMWLRSFERFFRIKNQPLSEKETKQLALRNWSEELRLVDNALLRAVHLCSSILSEEQVNQTRFDKYVEGYLKKDDTVDPYVEKLLRQSSPEAGLTLLRESFEDIHLVVSDLVNCRASPIRRSPRWGGSSTAKSGAATYWPSSSTRSSTHPRPITSHAVAGVIRKIEGPAERKHAAKVFLEFFRLLHYLDYADPARADDELKNTILIFALITSETRLLLATWSGGCLRSLDAASPLYELYDSFVYCIPLELKKVINTELLDISVARQSDNVRARVENSHGILKDCFQQSVVQLAQVFEPGLVGRDIFPDFTAKLEQSVQLRDGLAWLIKAVREFQARKEDGASVRLKEAISRFYDTNMKFLMYRDWSGFELFFIEILKCTSLPALLLISHRFETFLMTLYREVQKRAILQDVPLAEDLRLEAQA